ncbi:MAG: DUF2384 domain-containing protein [Proteobacteria bacterium]|nr:DUF2384 domain-containing protein [Pseudomonadota bacterium]
MSHFSWEDTGRIMDAAQETLIGSLRKISLQWELSLPELARIAHVPEEELGRFFALPEDEAVGLPTVPGALLGAVPLVGIFRMLVRTYPSPEAQNEWLKRPNGVFEGRRPIDVMAMSPDHLAYVAYTVESGLRLGGSR